MGDRDGRRVAEVSLTLDGVPVRIVILRDAQRRDAIRVSVYLPCIPIARPSSSSEQGTQFRVQCDDNREEEDRDFAGMRRGWGRIIFGEKYRRHMTP